MSVREFDFLPDDFQRVRQMLHQWAGISLAEHKSDMAYGRLSRRMRHLQVSSAAQYLDRVEQQPEERQEFINALTTNLTAFFREEHHFRYLAQQLQDAARSQAQPLKIWTCACSTGEEPYSLAMAAVEAFNSWTPPVRIFATDIDTRVVAEAKAGVYPLESMAKLGGARRDRFFQRGTGTQSGRVRVRPELQQLIRFQPLNLLSPTWPVKGPLTALFCRNLMIYFDKDTQLQLLQRFHPLLGSEGRFYAGHSESFAQAAHLFALQGNTVFRPLAPAVALQRRA